MSQSREPKTSATVIDPKVIAWMEKAAMVASGYAEAARAWDHAASLPGATGQSPGAERPLRYAVMRERRELVQAHRGLVQTVGRRRPLGLPDPFRGALDRLGVWLKENPTPPEHFACAVGASVDELVRRGQDPGLTLILTAARIMEDEAMKLLAQLPEEAFAGVALTPAEQAAWDALKGCRLKSSELARAVDTGEEYARRLVVGLRGKGRLIETAPGGGYWRPDAPPV